MNSINPQLVFPMFAMFVLTTVVFFIMTRNRMSAVKKGEMKVGFFKTYNTGIAAPESVAKADRHYVNLFEAPVLFYVACLLGLVLGIQSNVLVGFAWLFVVARCVHAFVHIGSNKLNIRAPAFGLSYASTGAMWITILIHTIALVA
jgi:hypothetical protein